MGVALTPDAVHQARTHDPPPPRRHPQRDPPRPLKRPPRGPQQPHPAYQPPQLRLSLRRSPHRPRLPLLQPHHHRPTAMTFTPNSTRAPQLADDLLGRVPDALHHDPSLLAHLRGRIELSQAPHRTTGVTPDQRTALAEVSVG